MAFFSGYSFSFEEKKEHTYGGFQKCFIRFCETSKRKAIATSRMEKLLIQTQKENQEKSEEKQQQYQQKQLEY